ncbi:MAG: radical SAM protein, partial [Bacteroidales bacterium]|nr:radical SAM protein [Bacteroidales bacterium]
MTDLAGRIINYLRISITDRCNLRCVYCMPPQGIRLLSHSDILSYDQITAFSQLAVGKGIRKIRITGGEPLVRKNVEKLIAMLAPIQGL